MKRSTGLVAVLLAGACATGGSWKPPTQQDRGDVPDVLRPGHGDAELHTWWPLTPPEVAALRGLEQARQGDAHALLALAIAASGDHRDAASYAGYQQRVDQFLAGIKPTIDGAADEWHRGYELHRAMHRAFFAGERTELGGYDVDQARVTGIFAGGHYNCLSSAVLFTVYGNWSIDHQNAGDWQSARQVLQDCVSQLPSAARCRDALADLESRHRF